MSETLNASPGYERHVSAPINVDHRLIPSCAPSGREPQRRDVALDLTDSLSTVSPPLSLSLSLSIPLPHSLHLAARPLVSPPKRKTKFLLLVSGAVRALNLHLVSRGNENLQARYVFTHQRFPSLHTCAQTHTLTQTRMHAGMGTHREEDQKYLCTNLTSLNSSSSSTPSTSTTCCFSFSTATTSSSYFYSLCR